MADTPIGPGTVLAGRYRLDDLLQETSGAKFWRATDRILARSVAVNVLDDADPRADAVLSAARSSATVTDGHFLRVLDAASEDGVVYVVNEWGSGISLDRMLAEETLPPRRAAWLVKEVADAITTAHRHGIAHGRLIPENVMVTEAGSVKLIGFVVDSVLSGRHKSTEIGGETLGDHESDVVNLAGLLYATLVGRWPGSEGSSLPDAPREHGRPLRPRQVKAGVPRPLDAICDRVLNTEAHEHNLPIETAHEVSAALSDFIGDPTGMAQVGYEPTTVISRADLGSETSGGTSADARGAASGDTTEQAAAEPAPDERPDTGMDPFTDPEATQAGEPPPEAADPEATQAGTPLFFDDDSGGSWDDEDSTQSMRREPASPPPPPPEPEPRPLFAPEPSGGRGTRRDPAPAPVAPPRSLRADPIENTGSQAPLWPWGPDAEQEDATQDTGSWDRQDAGKNWLRLAAIVAVCLLIVISAIVAFNLGRGSGDPGTEGTPSPTEEASPDQPARPIQIAGVTDLDPAGDPPEENPELAELAIDGDPSTAWQTMTYFNNPELGGLKDGVGLVVDLGEPAEVSQVRVTLQGRPTDFAVFTADEEPSDVDGLNRIARENNAGGKVDLELEEPVNTQYLVVWLTSLPAAEGGYQGRVAEIVVRP